MQLMDYRVLINKTQQECADELGVRQVSLSRWETGEASPRNCDIAKVHAWSKGAVTAQDFFETWIMKAGI